MNYARDARRLADYIVNINLMIYEVSETNALDHIGAIFTDAILQSGINYKYVVKPRVQNILECYPECKNRENFQFLVQEIGLEKLINWNGRVKVNRFKLLLNFMEINEINTCADLRIYLTSPFNRLELLKMNGIGPKTIDYLMKLLGNDNVAVDRHLYTFVKMADVNVEGYINTKLLVEYAADLLDLPRSALDYSIWNYMSNK